MVITRVVVAAIRHNRKRQVPSIFRGVGRVVGRGRNKFRRGSPKSFTVMFFVVVDSLDPSAGTSAHRAPQPASWAITRTSNAIASC